MDQVSQILSLCDIRVLSGDDSLTLPMLSVGGKGVISVAANIVPRDVAAMVNSFLEGNMDTARKIHFKLMPLFKAMFIETNPIPVKQSLVLMNMLEPEWRMPLCEPMPATVEKLKGVLKAQGLI